MVVVVETLQTKSCNQEGFFKVLWIFLTEGGGGEWEGIVAGKAEPG